MHKQKTHKTITSLYNETAHPQTGLLAKAGLSGEIMVEIDGGAPKAAKILSGNIRQDLIKPENAGREVLLIFEKGDPEKPVIIGMIENLLDDIISMDVNRENPAGPLETVIDDKCIVFEAQNEIVLKCGKGSITINKDGKIIVKGTNLLSRSSGSNRIKGASVAIN